MVGLPVQLDGLKNIVFIQEVLRVFGQKGRNLVWLVEFGGKVDGLVPLIQINALWARYAQL